MRQKTLLLLFLSLLALMPLLHAQEGASWTHFRGSGLNGIAPGKGFPLSWNDSTHVSWKTPIEGKGWSSPVVLDQQVWLTTASKEKKEMRAICLDLKSGKEVFNKLVFEPEKLHRIHAINSYATPTPAIEEGRIYVHFGRYGTACLNTRNGELIWERTDLQCEHIQGPGSSLLLYKNKLIVHMEGTDVQQILALDKLTGKTLWMTERPKDLYDAMPTIGKKAYITPIVMQVKGRPMLISNGSTVCIAYDPENGREIWRIRQGDDSTISMPVESEGMLFFYTSFITGEDGKKYAELFAVDPDGQGDITDTHIRWRMKAPILQLSTPVVVDGKLYTVDAKGEFFQLRASDGKVLWSEKLKGKFHSSPLYANGHIYVSSTKGETLVYSIETEPEKVSRNILGGEIWATPAMLAPSILVRTSEFLYKLDAD
jgi:outer membrane protein assembly factor BamB